MIDVTIHYPASHEASSFSTADGDKWSVSGYPTTEPDDDATPDDMELLASLLSQLIHDNPGAVRPFIAEKLARAFTNAIEAQGDYAEEATIPFCGLSADFKGQIIMQMIGHLGDDERGGLSREGKQTAVDVAEVIGPDHAQTLYHLARLVTKLA